MTREPNRAFAAAVAEARVSNKGLALRVRQLAQRDGQTSSTDHAAVKRYLDGMQPKLPAARYLAAALSEKLGRRLTPADIGFTAGTDETRPASLLLPPLTYPADVPAAAEHLGRLARFDAEVGTAPELARWDGDATPSVVTGYLFGSGAPSLDTAASSRGPLDAAAIRLTTANLMQLDFQLGGGHTRELLLFFFRNTVLPILSTGSRTTTAHRDLLSAAGELTQMLGWSAYDSGRHGAAQRYFVQTLRLAREAGDDPLGARLLANLSHQANFLGRFDEAVQLARAAQARLAPGSSKTLGAMLLAMEARALASLGDASACVAALSRAERAFERRDPDEDPPWIGYFDAAELAGETAHCFRDLRHATETETFAAIAIDPVLTPPRTRALIDMVRATGALHAGNLDQALATARAAVELSGGLRSSRWRSYVRDFLRAASTAHRQDARVVDLTTFVSERFRPPAATG
ncbi:MAG: hypothetical protein AB7I38_19345 [Dehalococcoidia bacterium]